MLNRLEAIKAPLIHSVNTLLLQLEAKIQGAMEVSIILCLNKVRDVIVSIIRLEAITSLY